MTTSFNDHPQSATIEIAVSDSQSTRRRIPCQFRQVKNRVLQVQALEPLPLSTPLSVEYSDALFLGETVACSKAQDGEWTLEIKVEQILTDLQRLLALRAHLLGESVPQEAYQTVGALRN